MTREDRWSLEITGYDCGPGQAGSSLVDGSSLRHTLTAVIRETAGSCGALHGPELSCADQGPSSALGIPSTSLSLPPASLLHGSVAHVLMATSPAHHTLAPFPACLMTPDPWCPQFLNSHGALNSSTEREKGSAVVCAQQQRGLTPSRCSECSENALGEILEVHSSPYLHSWAGNGPSTNPSLGAPLNAPPSTSLHQLVHLLERGS